MKKKLEDFTIEDLAQLRSEVSLNSIYTADFRNSFGIDPHSVQDFFDGFFEFILDVAHDEDDPELCKQLVGKVDMEFYDAVLDIYDTPDMLERWLYCFDDFSWVKYEEEEDDDE